MNTNFQYPTVIQSISAIRSDLRAFADKARIPDSEVRQITLVVEEIFSKITKFVFKDEGGHVLELSLSKSNSVILIELKDDGPAFNPLEDTPEQETDPVYIEDGGMGLSLIRAFCDSIRYERKEGKNRLYIQKMIRGQTENEQI